MRATVSVVVYPTWSNPPALIGDTVSPDGNNSPAIAPHTGAPALTVPMATTMPVGDAEVCGRPLPSEWKERGASRLLAVDVLCCHGFFLPSKAATAIRGLGAIRNRGAGLHGPLGGLDLQWVKGLHVRMRRAAGGPAAAGAPL